MTSAQQPGFKEAWDRSTPFLKSALEKSGGEYDVEDVLREVEDDHAMFFPIENGAAIFKIILYPKRRVLRLWLYGGKTGTGRANLKAIMEAADWYAELHECDGIELVGRKGWEKVLRPYGYEYKSVTLVKDLGE